MIAWFRSKLFKIDKHSLTENFTLFTFIILLYCYITFFAPYFYRGSREIGQFLGFARYLLIFVIPGYLLIILGGLIKGKILKTLISASYYFVLFSLVTFTLLFFFMEFRRFSTHFNNLIIFIIISGPIINTIVDYSDVIGIYPRIVPFKKNKTYIIDLGVLLGVVLFNLLLKYLINPILPNYAKVDTNLILYFPINNIFRVVVVVICLLLITLKTRLRRSSSIFMLNNTLHLLYFLIDGYTLLSMLINLSSRIHF